MVARPAPQSPNESVDTLKITHQCRHYTNATVLNVNSHFECRLRRLYRRLIGDTIVLKYYFQCSVLILKYSFQLDVSRVGTRQAINRIEVYVIRSDRDLGGNGRHKVHACITTTGAQTIPIDLLSDRCTRVRRPHPKHMSRHWCLTGRTVLIQK